MYDFIKQYNDLHRIIEPKLEKLGPQGYRHLSHFTIDDEGNISATWNASCGCCRDHDWTYHHVDDFTGEQ